MIQIDFFCSEIQSKTKKHKKLLLYNMMDEILKAWLSVPTT
jgi:hypothetical protein